jgi:hypothetical protein
MQFDRDTQRTLLLIRHNGVTFRLRKRNMGCQHMASH